MTSRKITNLLNNITLLDDPYEADKISSQEVVNYCEARFWVILQKLHVSENDTKKWMIKVLFRELVFFTGFFNIGSTHFTIGTMFLVHWSGSSDRQTDRHSGYHSVTWA